MKQVWHKLSPSVTPVPSPLFSSPTQALISPQAVPVGIVHVPYTYHVVTAEGASLRIFDLATMHPEFSGLVSGGNGTVMAPPTSAPVVGLAAIFNPDKVVAVHSDYRVMVWSLSTYAVLLDFLLSNQGGWVASVTATKDYVFVGMSCGEGDNRLPLCRNTIDVYEMRAGRRQTRLGFFTPPRQPDTLVGGCGWRVRAGAG